MRHSDDLIRRRLLARSAVDPATPEVNGVHCRVWTGKSKRGGYARMWDGWRLGDGHRLSYEVNIGPIPAGKDVCHRCDNPGCIEPLHLWAGTEQENTADMIAKGRHLEGRRITSEKLRGRVCPWARGANHGLAKLTEAQARSILTDSRSNSELGRLYGVSESLIRGIRVGRNWGWLNKPAAEVAPRRAPVPRIKKARFENYPVGPLRLRDVLGKRRA